MSLFHYVYTHSVAILFFFLAIVSALFHAFAPLPLLWMLAYGVALVYFPRMWIVAVPALLPLLDWSLWTGNLLYNEYDVLLLATLAVLFWRHDDSVKLVAPPYQLLYYLLLFAFIASFLKNAWPLFQEGAQPDDIYQNNWNSLRIGKGFFYAWLLWPFLRRELLIAPERCQRLLAIGLVASLFMFGLLVCWERGILNTLFTLHDRYALLSRILDFASTYRITGWFTEMHVGGEAVDGYLISLTPLVVYLLTRPTSPKVFYIILMAVGMGFYSIIVTFTRTTIASFIFAMLAFVIVLLVHKRQSSTTFQPSFIGLIFLFILNTVGLLIGFKMAGYQALFTGVFAIFGALLWAYFFRKHPWYLSFLVLTGIGWLAAWGICDSALESKWHDFTYPDAIQLAILLGRGEG